MSDKEPIKEYDKNNNLIYCKYSNGTELWREFDKNNNFIHHKNSNGFEFWREYDKNNNLIHYKDSNDLEGWYKYDEKNKRIEITEQEFKQIERRKEKQELYLNIKNSNRFEIMDI